MNEEQWLHPAYSMICFKDRQLPDVALLDVFFDNPCFADDRPYFVADELGDNGLFFLSDFDWNVATVPSDKLRFTAIYFSVAKDISISKDGD